MAEPDLGRMGPKRYLVEWSDEDSQWVATVEGVPSASWLADTPQDALGGYVERIEGADVGSVWHLSASEWHGLNLMMGDMDKSDDISGFLDAIARARGRLNDGT